MEEWPLNSLFSCAPTTIDGSNIGHVIAINTQICECFSVVKYRCSGNFVRWTRGRGSILAVTSMRSGEGKVNIGKNRSS
jgi:hypothetical protein